eukprot:11851804-Heterocapsa_arctica.AAC.1
MSACDGCEGWGPCVRRPGPRWWVFPRGEASLRSDFAGHLLTHCDPGVKECAAWARAEPVDTIPC